MSQTKIPIPNPDALQKLPKDGGEKWNRLVFSSSPYLLQHAANPVDWFPWGDEAFDLAKQQNKPIFLSIGYATCHWCHVMEHESFEDPAVAELLNEHFISIKVDREERPDIDAIYMAACQLTTGHGGWPLTAILNHDKQPFFVGTYFPKESRYGRMGMLELLPKITHVWQNERTKIEDGAQAITDRLSKMNQLEPADLDKDIFNRTVELFKSRFDSEFGGFGQAPKFPTPHQLSFLLDQYQQTQDSETLLMVESTLLAMRKGGMFDHVGFGFHRYSTDREWLLPHFEKMLYDQATLLKAYAQAFHITKNPFYKSVVYEIVDYVDRVLTHPDGGFFSAEDADSEGVEGKFYVWKMSEIQSILGPDALIWSKVYQIEADGNFKDEATHRKTGENIPHLKEPLARLSKSLKIPESELVEKLEEARKKLFKEREKRVHPLKDDKVLTDWNGLMIHALAEAGMFLQDPQLTEKASRALAFVQANLSRDENLLVKRYRNGQSGLPAHLDDYSFMSAGALSLYKATLDPKYLGLTIQWMEQLISQFWDKENGGFFQTEKNTKLLFRNKDFYDGAIPSGNSMAAWVLTHLAHINPESKYGQYLQQLVKASAANVNHYPAGHSNLLIGLSYAQAEKSELVLVGKNPSPFLEVVLEAQPQNLMILHVESQASQIRQFAPFTANMPWVDGENKAYFCKNYACSLPVSEPHALKQLLHGTK